MTEITVKKNGQPMEIRVLEDSQIVSVYETHMRMDFPKEELKPLRSILEMKARGAYDCLGLFSVSGNEVLAYAYLVREQEAGGYLLLDYLAACAAQRDQGYGSRMMQMLRDWYQDKNGIFLECECLRTSMDEAQMRTRRRRQNFYFRNGCVRTGVKAFVYGVEYDILYLPLRQTDPRYDVCLNMVYDEMFSEKARRDHVRMWKRSSKNRFACRFDSSKNRYQEKKSLFDSLGLCEGTCPRIISLVGAGGKTTTMYQLADELAEMGKRVLVTTTTHIARPSFGTVFEVDHIKQVTSSSWDGSILTVGKPEAVKETETSGKPAAALTPLRIKKLKMPDGLSDETELVRLLSCCDVILIEADGAACYPLKVPRAGEPVILPQTEMVIACVGLGAAGERWEDACFRFENHGGWMESDARERIDEAGMAKILCDCRGMKKGIPDQRCRYKILLNQADDDRRIQAAERIAQALPAQMREDCVITAYEPVRR